MTDARFFDLSFHQDEDRILMVCRGGTGSSQAVWLTRRITRRVLKEFGMLLLRSSVAAARAPASLRTDVIILEHQAALKRQAKASDASEPIGAGADGNGATDARRPAGAGSPGAKPTEARPGDRARLRLVGTESIALVSKIDVQIRSHSFTVSFFQGETVRLRTSFSRTGAHRLLSALDKLAQRAGWDVEPARGWLAQVDRTDPVDHARLM